MCFLNIKTCKNIPGDTQNKHMNLKKSMIKGFVLMWQIKVFLKLMFAYVGHTEASVLNWDCDR